MLCFLYVSAIGSCLALAGLLLERALPAGTPRRWIWCVTVMLSVTIPPIYQSQHVSSFPNTLGALNAGVWASLQPVESLVMRVWVLGSLFLIAWGTFTAWRVWRLGRAQHTIDGVPVVLTQSAGPATVGVIHSRVFIPQWVLALPAPQRRYVLKHEDEHRRAHDSRMLFIASLALILTPWNLALWWQLRRLSLAIEMDCDNRVVTALGDAQTYGELLFKVAQATSRGPHLQPGFIGRGMLERRLTLLLAPERLPRFMRYVLPALAVALLFIVLRTPHPMLDSTTTTAPHHVTRQ